MSLSGSSFASFCYSAFPNLVAPELLALELTYTPVRFHNITTYKQYRLRPMFINIPPPPTLADYSLMWVNQIDLLWCFLFPSWQSVCKMTR